jgi:ElaB/YqjD/DUF883 family membrane-anchored ribosome-binding protein
MSSAKQEPLSHHESLAYRISADWYKISVDNVKNVIKNHPGAALIISAGIGVLLGCLIKRR